MENDGAASCRTGPQDPREPLRPVGSVCKKRRRALVSKLAPLRRFYRRLRVLGREWLLELYTFLGRSRVLLRRGEVPFLDLGPAYRPHRETGLLGECTRTRGRIACMRDIRAEKLRLSMADKRLVLKGFDLGAEWTQNNPHFCTPHTGVHRKTQISCGVNLSKYWRGQF
jgi:hypothetical protein